MKAKDLIVLLRTMYLFAHNAHHLVARDTFFSDHEFFGDTYGTLQDDYDGVVERTIGLLGEKATGLDSLFSIITQEMTKTPSIEVVDNSDFFKYQLELEKRLCSMIKEIITTATPGTEQLIGEIANKSEIRQYKIQQRLKN